jgi:hypothetical protein
MLRALVIAMSLVTTAFALAATPSFPPSIAADLNGRSLSLPSDLPAERSIVVVSFRRAQSSQVRTWDNWLGSLGVVGRSVSLAVIDDPGLIGRTVIDNGMRLGVVATDARARIVTLYGDKSAFVSAIGLQTDTDIAVMVVDRSGRILAQAVGDFTPGVGRLLLSKLRMRT